MLYVQLDTNWPDHPKIIEAGLDGRGLHATVLCLAKRLERDGWVPLSLLLREGATEALVARLVELELLEQDGTMFRPWGWLDRNPSQAAIAARRASKAEAGKRGNHSKHGHPGTFENCTVCHPELLVVAPCDRTASQALAGDNSCDPVATKAEVEGEVAAAIAPAIASHPTTAFAKLPADQVEANVTNLRAIKSQVRR